MKNKRMLLVMAAVVLCAAGAIFFVRMNADPVVRLQIVEQEIETMAKGDTVQLHAVGYTKSGKQATEEQMTDLSLRWLVRFNGCTVDDSGYLTAVAEGSENVQVYSESADLYSRPITVYVKEG